MSRETLFCIIYAKKNDFGTIKLLLTNPTKAKLLINIKNQEGKTPLDIATSEKVKKYMISKGAKCGADIPAENAATQSARVQVQTPDLMNAFKKKTQPTKEPEVEPEQTTTKPLKTEDKSEKSEKLERTPEVFGTSETKAANTPRTRVAIPDELKNFTPLKFTKDDPSGLDDIIGLDDIKEELQKSIVKPLIKSKTSKILDKNGINIPNGILIYGSAGNGKTALTKALAGEIGLPVIELTNPENLEKIVAAAGKLFKEKNQRTILFIRGLEDFVGSGENYSMCCNHFVRNLTNASANGILIVATAKDRHGINKDVLVPGIMDKTFKIIAPNEETREKVISSYMSDKSALKEINTPESIKKIAEHTAGFSIAQIQHVINESVRSSVSSGKETVTLENLMEEIKTYSKEQDIPEINEFNKTSMYDTEIKREQYKKGDPQSLSDIGGMQDVKAQIVQKIIEPWQNKEEMDKYGIGMPDGVLLYGPSGSGKTYIVKGIARELGLPLYSLKLSGVASSFRHETTKNIKAIITQLKEKYEKTNEASVLFLDELDSLGKAKDEHSTGADTDEINTLLQELDNAGDKGIVVIAATNKLAQIEGALQRDGRLGERIYVGYADYDSRKDMIQNILSKNTFTEKLAQNNELLEKLTVDFEDMPSGSIAKILKEATYQTAIKGKPFEESVENALESYQEKELHDHLARKGIKNKGDYIKLDKKSTIKYDTKFDRTFLKDTEPHNFDELGGMQEIKNQLNKHIVQIWNPEVMRMFKENNIPMPGGVILYGPSGTGKTTIAKALSGEMKLPLYELNYSDVASSLIHKTSQNINELFEQLAYKYKKTGEMSILLIDELDKFAPERTLLGSNADYKKEEVSELLSIMNDASQNGIILIGTTNHLDQVDSAVKNNPRRMGTSIAVGYPDEASRISIIDKIFEGKSIAKNIKNEKDIKEIADMYEGFSVGAITDTLEKAIIHSLVYKEDLTLDLIKNFITNSENNDESKN